MEGEKSKIACHFEFVIFRIATLNSSASTKRSMAKDSGRYTAIELTTRKNVAYVMRGQAFAVCELKHIETRVDFSLGLRLPLLQPSWTLMIKESYNFFSRKAQCGHPALLS